jgi:hypothetical protein
MTQVGATSTHVIIAQVNNNTYDIRSEKLIPKGTQLRFVGFLSLVEPKVLGLYPPFDIADLVTIGTKKKILNTPLTELTFFLDEISTHDLT